LIDIPVFFPTVSSQYMPEFIHLLNYSCMHADSTHNRPSIFFFGLNKGGFGGKTG
jgi:hypothetical protein